MHQNGSSFVWLLHSKWKNMGTDLLWHSTNTSWIYIKCTLLCSLYNTNNGSDNIHFNGKQMLCFSDSYWREKTRFLLILLTLFFLVSAETPSFIIHYVFWSVDANMGLNIQRPCPASSLFDQMLSNRIWWARKQLLSLCSDWLSQVWISQGGTDVSFLINPLVAWDDLSIQPCVSLNVTVRLCK